jgi:DNA-binding transcriptional regulator YiaG
MAASTRSSKKSRKPRRQATAKSSRVRSVVATSRGAPQRLSVRQLRERFGVSRKIFSRVVGFSERAIADWEADKPLSDSCLQRMRELSRLQKALAGVMHEEFVGTWLNTPNDAFDGLKPLELIERGEVDRLWRMIYQLESGVPT